MKHEIRCVCRNHMTLITIKALEDMCYFQCENCGKLERRKWNDIQEERQSHNYT